MIMSKAKKVEQKLITFTDNEYELARVQQEINSGWFIASLMANGRNYVGILEKKEESENIYIPPRKKIKILD